GHTGPFAQTLPHDLDRHELDRLVLAGAMTVGLLVLLAEGFLEQRHHLVVDRPFGHRHGELVALSLIVQRRRPSQADARAVEILGGELRRRLVGKARPGTLYL